MPSLPAQTPEVERFLILLAEAEAGAPDVLPQMRQLLAESDAVNAYLEVDDVAAVRYALVDDSL